LAVFQFNVTGYGVSLSVRIYMAIGLRWRKFTVAA
jgi:hypothetical protein